MQFRPFRTLALLAVIAGASTLRAQAAPAAAPAPAPKPTDAQVAAAVDTLRTEIAAARKQTVAENMNLTADEATKFWPVYDTYRAEMKKLKDAEWAVIQAYAKNYTMMSDTVSQRIVNEWMTSKSAQQALRASYAPKFAAAVGWTKAGRYLQIENRLDALLDLARAKQIPLAK
jgi:Spy/CpxP family protein refolding chaperone